MRSSQNRISNSDQVLTPGSTPLVEALPTGRDKAGGEAGKMSATRLLASRQEIHQRLLSGERDISTWLIQGDPYRSCDLDFENHFVDVFTEPGPWTIGNNEAYDLELSRWG